MSKAVGTTVDLGLAIGPSFGELCAVDVKNKKVLWQRKSYLAKESIGGLLKKFLAENETASIRKLKISCRFFEKIFHSRLGGTVAQIVTEGFETLPVLRQPIGPNFFTMTPSRVDPLASQELIFGIKERVSAEGKVLTPVDMSELASIAEKLKAQSIQKVVVNLLFSGKNPTHQKQINDFFTEQGFLVFCQNRNENSLDEVSSWRTQILDACLEGTYKDLIEDLLKDAEGKVTPEQIYLLDGQGNLHTEHHNHLTQTLFSTYYCLSLEGKKTNKGHMHLGFENWWITDPNRHSQYWLSPWGRLEIPHPYTKRLSVQPTMELVSDFWGDIDFSLNELGFEPGPMSLGRAQKPLVFDLFAEEMTHHYPELIQANGHKKFENVLGALGKATEKTVGKSYQELKKSLQDKIKSQISIEISHSFAWRDLTFSGEMASLLFPELQQNLTEKAYCVALQGI